MANTKNGTKTPWLEKALQGTSRQILHAMAVAALESPRQADMEWERAADAEERVACLLEAEGHELEAAVHRVSAASCYAKVGHYPHAVTLLKAALSFPLRDAYRREVEKLLKQWLPKAKRLLRQQARRRPVTVS